MPVLKQGQGTVAFQLTATSSGHDEVLDVQVTVNPNLHLRHCLQPHQYLRVLCNAHGWRLLRIC